MHPEPELGLLRVSHTGTEHDKRSLARNFYSSLGNPDVYVATLVGGVAFSDLTADTSFPSIL